jgi:localization factor PodJL
MTSGAPWSVKGIDPKAREVAKDLARRSGMTLGEWLNRMILEDEGPEEVTSQDQVAERGSRRYAQGGRSEAAAFRFELGHEDDKDVTRTAGAVERLTARMEEAETRMGLAISGVEHSVREALARIEAGEREQGAAAGRFDKLAVSHQTLADRLRQIETNGPQSKSVEALKSLEQALVKVAGQISERDARTREMLDTVSERVERLEERESGGAFGLADAAGRLGERLAEAEAKTAGALEGLRASFAALDSRLNTVEGGASGVELRLEDLAASLSERVEAVRDDVAEQLRVSADQRFDSLEHKLGEVAQHMDAAEQRSAQAIEQMGQDFKSVAETLNRRLAEAEERGSAAAGSGGPGMSEVASAIDSRLARAESVQAEALERLSGEIARITESLGDRIAAAERRSAQAIDEVGEQVVRVTDRLNQRHERSSQELSDRIRQSEERTARLLDEARERVDRQLGEARRISDVEPGLEAAPASRFSSFAESVPASRISSFSGDFPDIGPAESDARAEPPPLGDFPVAGAAAKEPAFDAADFAAAESFSPDELFEAPPEVEPNSAFAADEAPAAAEAFDDNAIFDAEFEPAGTADAEDASAGDHADVLFEPTEAKAPPSAPQAVDPFPDEMFDDDTEFLSPAAAPARGHQTQDQRAQALDELFDLEIEEPGPSAHSDGPEAVHQTSGRPLTTREIIEQARAAARASSTTGGDKNGNGGKKGLKSPRPSLGGLLSGLGRGRGKRRQTTLQTALLIAGGAAFLSVGAAGLVVMSGKPGGAPPKRVADAIERDDAVGAAAVGEGATFGAPRAAIALAPQIAGGAGPMVAATPDPEIITAYQEGVRALEAGETGGLEAVRKAANLGYAPAQRFLAKVSETGAHGVKTDLATARRWMERAAQAGDRGAMHDVALYYIRGVGGSKDVAGAAQWFRRAADLGLVDSQYNLGVLYEKGIGVQQNAAESYKWFLVAGRSGDLEARRSAQRVRGGLSSEAQAVAERAAAGYRAAVSGVAPSAAAADATATAQQALSSLGFYRGPRDGRSSPALTMAIAAYQREQGLPATGALDQVTVTRLQVFTR